MSETRTLDQVHKEYSKVCMEAGHLGYKMYTLCADLDILEGQLKDLHQQARDLSLEASKISAATQVESAK